jgi:hypothetical protein
MPISINDLRSAAGRAYRAVVAKSLNEAFAMRIQTAFLCHSHRDEELAKGLQVLLLEEGWQLYIDWQDNEMPDQPNKTTANKIKQKIKELDWFLFLATPNSKSSKWCPWEIGFADSEKSHDRIVIVPTTDASGNWYGNEYLQLYKQITTASGGGLAVFPVGQSSGGRYVRNL